MKTLCLYFFLICFISATAQQSNLRGIVSIQNSEIETGKRQYVANAQVEDDFGKAQPTITDANGHFQLVYVGVGEKTTVSFQVKKANLEVVNKDALEAVAGQYDPVKISMATREKIDEYRRQIYNIGKTAAEKNLKKAIIQKEAELAVLRKNNTLNVARIQKIEEDLVVLNGKMSQIDAQATELARKYAPVNLDDSSPFFKEAFNVFQKGHLDSALMILKKLNLAYMAGQILKERNKLDELQKELFVRDSVQRERTKDVAQALEFKADLHNNRFEYDSAIICYEWLFLLDSNNCWNLINYANAFETLNQVEKALHYYIKALEKAKELKETVNNKINLSFIYLGLGNLFKTKGDYKQAEEYYKQNLGIFKSLAVSDSRFESFVADAKLNLGVIYRLTNKYKEAESTYLDICDIYKQLKQSNSSIESIYARAQSNLGVLYFYQKKYVQAAAVCKKSVEIYTRLSHVVFLPELANAQSVLGDIYNELDDTANAMIAFKQAVTIYLNMVKTSPSAFEPSLAKTLIGLGNCFIQKGDLSRAEGSYIKALELYRKIDSANPQVYRKDLIVNIGRIGNLYTQYKKYDLAEMAYTKAISLFEKFEKTNPRVFDFNKAALLIDAGRFYFEKKNYMKSEDLYRKAFNICKQHAIENPQIYEPKMVFTVTCLADLFRKIGEPMKLSTVYLESLEVYKLLRDKDQNTYEPVLARTYFELSQLLVDLSDYNGAKTAYLKSLEIYQRLAYNNSLYMSNVGLIQYGLGCLYKYEKKYVLAKSAFLQAFEIWKPQSEDKRFIQEVADIQNCLGYIFMEVDQDLVRAEASYLEALKYKKQLVKTDSSYQKDVANVYYNLGLLYSYKNEYDLAESYSKMALQLYKQLEKRKPQAYSSNIAGTQKNLGVLYWMKKDFIKASLAYQDALTLFGQLALKDPQTYEQDRIKTQLSLGDIYRQLKNYAKAEQLLLDNFNIGEKKWIDLYPNVWNANTKLLFDLYFDIMDTISSKAGMIPWQRKVVDIAARLYVLSGNSEKLIDEYVGNISLLAWYLLFDRKFEESETFSRKGLQLDANSGYVKINLAHSLLLRGKYTEAAKIYKEMKLLKNEKGESFAGICLFQLDMLEKAGIIHKDMNDIRAILRN